MMTLAPERTPLLDAGHIVLDDVSWEFYLRVLDEIGERPIRVTFSEGSIEIISPLPKHELWGGWINRLIELICLDRRIKVAALGSTTFRMEDRQKGLEPDKCYYIKNADAGLNMDEAFDARSDPPPDLAVEIDISRRSIPRQPIYAALGVPELWRFDGKTLQVMLLSARGEYEVSDKSAVFPFLPVSEFSRFILRMREADQFKLIEEFRTWLFNIPK